MTDLSQYKILVVDDEEMLRKVFEFDLKRLKLNVLTANSGNSALSILKNQQIDIVISDARMADGDGLELIDKAFAEIQDPPTIILLTGFSEVPIDEVYHQGADSIFAKPFDRKQILECIKKILSSKKTFWNVSEDLSLPIKNEISLSFSDLDLALEMRAISLGRGGLFIETKSEFPNINDIISVNIHFEHGEVKKVHFVAQVKWVRSKPINSNPSGYGVEFLNLGENEKKILLKIIEDKKIIPYIPKK